MRMCMVESVSAGERTGPGYRPPFGPLWTGLDDCPCACRHALPITGPVPSVDPARLGTLRDDYGDLAADLLDLFEKTAAATLGELRAALDTGDAGEVRRLAHRLKGSARNVGATGMAEVAAALEQGPADAPATLERLEAALEPTRAQLRARARALDARGLLEHLALPPAHVEDAGAREALRLVEADERRRSRPAVDAQHLDAPLHRELVRQPHEPRADPVPGVAARGDQQLHVELGAVDRLHVGRGAADPEGRGGLAEDGGAGRLPPAPRHPQPRVLGELAHARAGLRPLRERPVAPLAGLTARDHPRDRLVEQVEQR